MAETSRSRQGELVRTVFDVLRDRPDGVPEGDSLQNRIYGYEDVYGSLPRLTPAPSLSGSRPPADTRRTTSETTRATSRDASSRPHSVRFAATFGVVRQ